jgi:hypothetical protein
METRDRARSDLYLAQLRTQSAPNTPGFGPMSPYSMKSPRFPPAAYSALGEMEEGFAPKTRFVDAKPVPTKAFSLQPAPTKAHAASSKTSSGRFESRSPPPQENVIDHAPSAPGEKQYESVPIPGAYVDPASPKATQQTFGFTSIPGQAMTSERRIESPPSSPRLPRAGSR